MVHAAGAGDNPREHVMKNAILISLTLVMLASGAFAANLVCYSPHDDGVDPTAPLTISVVVD
ncbi:hypothetical protein ASD45_17130 [Pseudolabrys sp. Root1462]|jgi:hypothetical protein|nr:hypothetical protein ASD45_17130 [Pseudolabrys sp. Root1462]